MSIEESIEIVVDIHEGYSIVNYDPRRRNLDHYRLVWKVVLVLYY